MNPPYVMVIKGSSRKQGNSSTLADSVIAGAQAVGAEVEGVELREMNLQFCTGCDACQTTTDTDCVLDDDMRTLFPKLRRVDALVLAMPIYWYSVNAQMKTFMDRAFYGLLGPQGHPLAGKSIGLIITYGDSDPFTSGAVNALRSFQDIFRHIGAPIVGTVYGTAFELGAIQKQSALLEKAYQLGQQVGARSPQ